MISKIQFVIPKYQPEQLACERRHIHSDSCCYWLSVIRSRLRFLLPAVLLLLALCAHAGGIVAGCTEAAFRAALVGGGTVTFTNDCSIMISAQILIDEAGITIDANSHKVSIGSSNSVPLFDVSADMFLHGVSLINGAGTDAGAALYIHPGVVVTANSCTFAGNTALGTNGLAGLNGTTNSASIGGNATSGTSGAFGYGGAIYNMGTLALVNCTLTNNTATGGDGGAGGAGGTGSGTFTLGGNGGNGAGAGSGFGGAIYNLGKLTLINCTFSANNVIGGNGGSGGAGGAGSASGMLGNGGVGGAASGGAVYNAKSLTILSSTFSANSAHGGSAAAAAMSGNGTGLKGIKGAQAAGGALFNTWWAVMTNCTFYTNSAVGGAGGAGGNGGGTFAVPGDGGDGGNGIGGGVENANNITIVNCTLSRNGAFGGTNGPPGSGNSSADNGHLGLAQGGNIANNASVILNLMNSILANSASGANEFGAFTDGGDNLSSDSSSSFGGSSLQNTNPKLGPLAANGGPTLTMALLTGSPAIDRVSAERSPVTDQRGFSRPFNTLADIGAFEYGAAASISHITLTIAHGTNGRFQLSGAGTTGQTYFIQSSTNLASWQTLSTNIAPIQFTDPVTNLPTRFYRITR